MALAGFIFIIGTIWDAITDPLIGMWSDKTQTKPGKFRLVPIHGRRLPFVFWGSIFMIFTSILFWYPPIPKTHFLNFLYGSALLCLHWTAFTITVVPLCALGPEIARSERARLRLGTWFSIGMIVGLALANVLPGVLISVLDPARANGEFSAVGYRRVAIIFSLVSFALFQLPVWFIRERYDSDAHDIEHAAWLSGALDAARNFPFVIYCAAFFLFTVGFLAVQNALPYFAQLGLGGDESLMTVLMAPFIVACLAFIGIVPKLTKLLHTKWMTFIAFLIITSGLPLMYPLAHMETSTTVKTILGGALFAYCGIAQAIMYVMMVPMLGEIMDFDELRSGQRREALYNGFHGFIMKGAIAFAILLSTQSMRFFGNSVEEPTGVFLVGPFGALFTFLGMIVILFYPILNVAKGEESEDTQ